MKVRCALRCALGLSSHFLSCCTLSFSLHPPTSLFTSQLPSSRVRHSTFPLPPNSPICLFTHTSFLFVLHSSMLLSSFLPKPLFFITIPPYKNTISLSWLQNLGCMLFLSGHYGSSNLPWQTRRDPQTKRLMENITLQNSSVVRACVSGTRLYGNHAPIHLPRTTEFTETGL